MSKFRLAEDPSTLSPLPPKSAPLLLWHKALLGFILVAHLALGIVMATNIPVLPINSGSLIHAPDEAAHIEYIRILHDEHRLPRQGQTTYEWHQPPLYYAVAAVVYPLGYVAMRCISIAFGLGSLILIFLTARQLFPEWPLVAISATGFVGLMPMHQAINATVGNDCLIELLFCFFFYNCSQALLTGLTAIRAIHIGLIVAGALLTKSNSVILLPLAVLLWYFLWRIGELPAKLKRGAVTAGLLICILTAGWYARNYRLYGEVTLVKGFMREFEHTQRASDWIGQDVVLEAWTGRIHQVTGSNMSRMDYEALIANWTFRSFIAAYTPFAVAKVGAPRFLPPNAYLLPALLMLAGIVGWLKKVDQSSALNSHQKAFAKVLFVGLALVVLSFFGFTLTFFQGQGRYLFPALLPMSILLAYGWKRLLPERYFKPFVLFGLFVMFAISIAFVATGVIQTATSSATQTGSAPSSGITS
ncbi:MAG: hypothetical protein ABJA67_13350 [Chthonomonadales bacterium]